IPSPVKDQVQFNSVNADAVELNRSGSRASLELQSRLQPVHHPREGNRLSDVLQSTDPRDSPFEAETEARVHERPVAAKIEIPVVCIQRQPLFFDPPYESIVVVLSLGTADDL